MKSGKIWIWVFTILVDLLESSDFFFELLPLAVKILGMDTDIADLVAIYACIRI